MTRIDTLNSNCVSELKLSADWKAVSFPEPLVVGGGGGGESGNSAILDAKHWNPQIYNVQVMNVCVRFQTGTCTVTCGM